MNIRISSRFLFLLIIIWSLTITSFSYSNEELTVEQIILLMKASSEQYETINAKMKRISYKINDSNQESITSTKEIVSRWTRDKTFSKTRETLYLEEPIREDFIPTHIITYAITPEWSKRLVEAPNDVTTPRGVIKQGRSLESQQPFYDIYTALWDLAGWPWEKINYEESSVINFTDEGYYVLKIKLGIQPNGPFLRLYIDPSKNYIPVIKEFLKHDDTLLIRYECSDFHQDDKGIWIPYQYSYSDPREKYLAKYNVEEVVVNEPISDELLNCTFPPGTIVSDEITGLRYQISEMIVSQEALKGIENTDYVRQEDLLFEIEDVEEASAADEDELLEIGTQTKELLQISNKPRKTNYAIYVIGLISLFIVLLVIGFISKYKITK